jgi:hypothetical protein
MADIAEHHSEIHRLPLFDCRRRQAPWPARMTGYRLDRWSTVTPIYGGASWLR